MGIDRHEWEHRNYKSGRAATTPARERDDPAQLAPDASLGMEESPLQPEMPPQAPKTPKGIPKAAPATRTSRTTKTTPDRKPGSKPSARARR